MTTMSDDRAVERVKITETDLGVAQETRATDLFREERRWEQVFVLGVTPLGFTGSFDTNVFERI